MKTTYSGTPQCPASHGSVPFMHYSIYDATYIGEAMEMYFGSLVLAFLVILGRLGPGKLARLSSFQPVLLRWEVAGEELPRKEEAICDILTLLRKFCN